jgi:hypothetical protein
MRRRRNDAVPPGELLAFDGSQYKTNATWNAALDEFIAARARWAAEHGVPLNQMPSYTVGDEPWDAFLI